jgi:hypothetical protein
MAMMSDAESSGDNWRDKAGGDPESVVANCADDEQDVSAVEVQQAATASNTLRRQVEARMIFPRSSLEGD